MASTIFSNTASCHHRPLPPLCEWSMSSSSPPPPPLPPPPVEDLLEDPPRCRWDFHLSTVVSSEASASIASSDAIGSIDFDPSGRLFATGGIARRIRVYSVGSLLPEEEEEEPGTIFKDHTSACEAYLCVPAKLSSVRWRSGGVVGCGDYDGVVTEYDLERRAVVAERDEHAGRRVWSVDYSPDGRLGASGSDDGAAHVWDTRSPAAGWEVARAGGGAAVCCVEFDPDGGPWLAVGGADRKAHMYDVRSIGRGPVANLEGHSRAVTYVRFAGEGKAVTSAADGTHRLWEWESGREVREYRGHVNGRSFVGMGVWRGGGLIASGSESNEVYVYDLRWGVPIWVRSFGERRERNEFVSAVSWRQGITGEKDEDGVLVAGGSNGVLQVFSCRKIEGLQ
ncbi:WD repeat-containing protein RUP1-like [Typha angustifolia]|uniref:WD repeat-containing protein RUP1-like n=1 Tax=Typha angustifolia TaxID=59011 RepID=UPI003C2ED598